jgi:hypothetical protein
MQSHFGSSKFVLALCFALPALPAHAADVAVDCSKKSLVNELGKLNKLATNTVQISGSCVEDVVIDGHLNLTLVGNGGASISATDPGTTAVAINNSRVTVKDLTLNGGSTAAGCDNRSTCIFRDVAVQGGQSGLTAQGQSAIDIIGASSVVGSTGSGVGVYGASSVNMRPTWANGFDNTELGPVISGHEIGIIVQDGSFLRTDNVTIADNGLGIEARRNATIKVFGNGSGAVISGNSGWGIRVTQSSVGQITEDFADNGTAVVVGPLSYVTVQGGTYSGNGSDTFCQHPTAVLEGLFSCP